MVKYSLTFLLFLCFIVQSWAHAIWLETASTGKIGKEQVIKIYFGEYGYGVTEEVDSDSFKKMKEFTLWVINSQGDKSQITVVDKGNHYQGKYIPNAKGIHTIVLDNDKIEVIDFSQYDFGIFKTHYHASATFNVGYGDTPSADFNPLGISIIEHPTVGNTTKIQALYKGEPMPECEVEISLPGQWKKTMKADKQGIIYLSLPWPELYQIEVSQKEEKSGVYKGEPYEFIWHAATYTINRK